MRATPLPVGVHPHPRLVSSGMNRGGTPGTGGDSPRRDAHGEIVEAGARLQHVVGGDNPISHSGQWELEREVPCILLPRAGRGWSRDAQCGHLLITLLERFTGAKRAALDSRKRWVLKPKCAFSHPAPHWPARAQAHSISTLGSQGLGSWEALYNTLGCHLLRVWNHGLL